MNSHTVQMLETVRGVLEAKAKPKWDRDGQDTYETQWLGDEEHPVGEVHPEYNATRRAGGSAKPDKWKAVVGTKVLGSFPNLRDAKKAVETALGHHAHEALESDYAAPPFYLYLTKHASDQEVWFYATSELKNGGYKGTQVVHWKGDKKPKKAVQKTIGHGEMSAWKKVSKDELPPDVAARFG